MMASIFFMTDFAQYTQPVPRLPKHTESKPAIEHGKIHTADYFSCCGSRY
jgi:hypothetical protein